MSSIALCKFAIRVILLGILMFFISVVDINMTSSTISSFMDETTKVNNNEDKFHHVASAASEQQQQQQQQTSRSPEAATATTLPEAAAAVQVVRLEENIPPPPPPNVPPEIVVGSDPATNTRMHKKRKKKKKKKTTNIRKKQSSNTIPMTPDIAGDSDHETSSTPETPAPTPEAPETQAPETAAPETLAPETAAPETQALETTGHKTPEPTTGQATGQAPAPAPPAPDLSSTTNNTTLAAAGLWVHVVTWGEGMAGWRESLQEVLTFCKMYNATFVEPCVKNARLTSCSNLLKKDDASDNDDIVRLGNMMDLDQLRQYLHKKIVSHDEFVKATGYDRHNRQDNPHIFPLCLTKGSCKDFGGNKLKSVAQKHSMPVVDEAVEYARQDNMAILEVLSYRKWAFKQYVPGGDSNSKLPTVSSQIKRHAMQHVGFPKAEYDRIETMLAEKLGIAKGSKFAAIQWRPEAVYPLNYTECAEAILEARDIISQRDGIPLSNFMLMSPLSHQKELQWGGVAKLADKHSDISYPALQKLLDAGFKKLELAFEGDVADGGMLAIWDFILAQTATTFSTCGGKCNKKRYCTKCNYQGASVSYVISLRKHYTNDQGTTDRCWPETSESS